MKSIFDLREFEIRASQKLPEPIFDFFSGGANDEITLKDNCNSYDDIKLLPRFLRNVEICNLSTKILGNNINSPILIAPMAFQKLAHPMGETATAIAASEHNIIMNVSTYSTSSFKEIKEVSTIPPWLQLYIYKDRNITKNLVQTAEKEGYGAIVLTVDAPYYGKRSRELKNSFIFPDTVKLKNLQDAGLSLDKISARDLPRYLSSLLDPSITWKEVEWLRSITSLPILLKGVIHPGDAVMAVKNNINGIIISNHGGRQLDTTLSSIKALSPIKNIVEDNIEIIIDGGIRRGTDILKALALGANAIMVGRPILWGLAINGQNGVNKVLDILYEELKLAMNLCGYTSIDKINKEMLYISQ